MARTKKWAGSQLGLITSSALGFTVYLLLATLATTEGTAKSEFSRTSKSISNGLEGQLMSANRLTGMTGEANSQTASFRLASGVDTSIRVINGVKTSR